MVAAFKVAANIGGVGSTEGTLRVDRILLLTLNVAYMTVSVCGNVSICILMVCALLCVFIMLQWKHFK